MSDAEEDPFAGPGPAARYRDALAAGRFELQSCDACARQVFPPRALCPFCGSPRLSWRAASGRGTVYSTTVVRERPEQGGPRNIALIDLAEGARLMSRVEGIAPEAVRIGMAVKARIASTEAGPLLVFDPA
ncbi:MAG TPA: OB-fold domain-containing protein [Stellaceae bacterium]|nr:OB-fold domain-containing protein [Stellaceae bacterium]